MFQLSLNSPKKLLFIIKLTFDYPISITFIDKSFTIHNRVTGKVVVISRCDDGLYVLKHGHSTFLSTFNYNSLHVSYDICKLNKAFYGLKQAPRAWFHCFSSFLLYFGFFCNHSDTSFFVLTRSDNLIYLLLYIDDIVVIDNDDALLRDFIQCFHRELVTKDLDYLSYFIGLEVSFFAT